MKICAKCSIEKPVDQFHRNNASRDGRNYRCKACVKSYTTRTDVQNRSKMWERNNPTKILLTQAKGRAKRLNLPFSLTHEEVVIPQLCPILGIPLSKGSGSLHDGSPTLDRIVPSLGYVSGNVRVVSMKANRIKNNATFDELIKLGEWASQQR